MDEVKGMKAISLPGERKGKTKSVKTGCPRSTLSGLNLAGGYLKSPIGCPRSTLNDPSLAGGDQVVQSGCPRSTLSNPSLAGGDQENPVGCPRSTLTTTCRNDGDSSFSTGCSRSTLSDVSQAGCQVPKTKCSTLKSSVRGGISDSKVCPRSTLKSYSKAGAVEGNGSSGCRQSHDREDYTIVGNDVEALFPSLTDIDSARIAREAVVNSDLKFENVDVSAALKYLKLCGGEDHVREIGLGKVAPRWLGQRSDLLTLGGEALSEENKWSKVRREFTEHEKRVIIARVIETAVLICMSTHIYSFGPDLFLQCSGGPIGMRFTASLASIVMKEWDKAWMQLMERENLEFDMFLRYVDDCRLFLRALNPGWTWTGEKFEYLSSMAKSDSEEGISAVQRTTREITKAMCSMTSFLRFTGEDVSMFDGGVLPTLDTSLWIENGLIKFMFFEKPTIGNQVLNKDTALPTASLWSSLLQETVRRLLNCCSDLDIKKKRKILSEYGQKLINSGHSVKSARIIMVQGVVKYLWKVELSNLSEDDPKFCPLYLDKTYNEECRQVSKYRAKMSWYKCKKKKNTSVSSEDCDVGWRGRLVGVWRGKNQSQKPTLPGGFTTVLNVPNTKGASLAMKLIRQEPKLARMTNYNVKIIEKSGIQLCRLFQRIFTQKTCSRPHCPVCEFCDEKT